MCGCSEFNLDNNNVHHWIDTITIPFMGLLEHQVLKFEQTSHTQYIDNIGC